MTPTTKALPCPLCGSTNIDSKEWIGVDERLPNMGQVVLVHGGVAQYRGADVGWYSLTGIDWPGRPIQWDVTHWMPIPEARV